MSIRPNYSPAPEHPIHQNGIFGPTGSSKCLGVAASEDRSAKEASKRSKPSKVKGRRREGEGGAEGRKASKLRTKASKASKGQDEGFEGFEGQGRRCSEGFEGEEGVGGFEGFEGEDEGVEGLSKGRREGVQTWYVFLLDLLWRPNLKGTVFGWVLGPKKRPRRMCR